MAFARVQQKGEKTRVVQLSASDTEGLKNIELGKPRLQPRELRADEKFLQMLARFEEGLHSPISINQ